MYTVNILRKQTDLQTKRVLIDFEYLKNGVQVATEQQSFGIDVSIEDVKRYAYQQTKRFEKFDASLSLITDGALDIATAVEVQPTQAELDKVEWFRDFNRLEQVQRLITLGALLGTEAPVVALRKKVKDNFKPAYIADM